jgi:hypothetical protein
MWEARSFLLTDGLGSVSVALNSGGFNPVTAKQLFVPFGRVRYSSSTMPTTKGFTGRRQDATK